jgi:cytochrome b6-f complex iron-sulfur subunit
MSEMEHPAVDQTQTTPADQAESGEQDLTRRSFFKIAVGGMACVYAAAIAYPVYEYLASPVEESIAEASIKAVDLKLSDVPPPGQSTMFMFGPHPAMLIHFADGTLVALTAVCTHLGCTLHYDPPAPRIVCPCHGGQYDPHTGQNLAGPPPAPLTKYIVTTSKTKVTISRP